MLDSFSIRNGYEPYPLLKLDGLSDSCKNRLWNKFNDIIQENEEDSLVLSHAIDAILDGIGKEKLTVPAKWREGSDTIKAYWDVMWYRAFNVLEDFLKYAYSDASQLNRNGNDYLNEFNRILEEENSGYRFSKDKAIKVANEAELENLNEAMNTEFDPVNIAMQKAAKLYSAPSPDYENSIKESISAVEAMCNCITNQRKSLGEAIEHLEKHGCNIHLAMKKGFKELYGYTSDAGGIRHASIDFANATEADARYMLISCSAFINYLKSQMKKGDEH